MKSLLACLLLGLLAAVSPANAQKDSKIPPGGDRIETPVVEVHVSLANVGGGTLITSPSPKPRTSDTKAGDDLDRDPRVGDTLIIHGKYVLHSREKARISLILNQPKGKTRPIIFSLPSLEVKKGAGDFELKYAPTLEGFLSIAFFTVPGNKRFYEKPMTPILPTWTGTLGPEKATSETSPSDTPPPVRPLR